MPTTQQKPIQNQPQKKSFIIIKYTREKEWYRIDDVIDEEEAFEILYDGDCEPFKDKITGSDEEIFEIDPVTGLEK